MNKVKNSLKHLMDVVEPIEPVDAEEAEEVEEEKDSIMKGEEEVVKAKSTLNEDQLNAFDGIEKFLLDSKKSMTTIIGYAGTGKTYLISKIVSATRGKIAMTAPTNKAVKVLADNKTPELAGVAYATIHKLLALKLNWVFPKGDQKFDPYQKLVSIYGKEPSVNEYKILIVDEASMLDDELFHMIMRVKDASLKVIFLGDAAQIPPVGKPDSIPLKEESQKKYNIDVFVLDKTMRQKEGSGILKTAGSIRDNRFEFGDTIKDRSTTLDVEFVKRYNLEQETLFKKSMIKDFMSDDFSKDPNFCKVIAWRNDTVDKFNQVIRSHLYQTEDLDFIMPGEKLIADTPVMKKVKSINYRGSEVMTTKIIFNTSDEFTVVSYVPKVFNYNRPDTKSEREERNQLMFDDEDFSIIDKKKKLFSISYYETIVEENGADHKIDILHPSGVEPLKWAISEIFRYKMFSEYEMLKERFAKVKYNYAITAHKSQGSTYKNVYIIEDDIDKNQNLVERNRIKYTAVSRASEKLYILSKRNKR